LTRVWSTQALGHGDEAHKEALKKMGEILRLRDIVNLRGSLETPEVYWDLPELEGMYELISREFELSRRVSLLNLKLDYTQELVEARRIQLKDRRSTMLTNWIIGNSFSKVLFVVTLHRKYSRVFTFSECVPALIVACCLIKALSFTESTDKKRPDLQEKGGGGGSAVPPIPRLKRVVSSSSSTASSAPNHTSSSFASPAAASS
jgi:hypothetical protein